MGSYSMNAARLKVSVVIPSYNEEKYLATTLRAVLAQQYENFEIIVVDNASTDHTEDIARSFKGVRVMRENRRGTQFARECGRKSAQGDIIAFIDADCHPDPNWLASTVNLFSDHRIVAVGGAYDYYDARAFVRYALLFLQRIVYVPANLLLRLFHAGGILVGGNLVARATALESVGGLDTSFVFWGDDTDTARNLSKVGRIYFGWNPVMKSSARRFKSEGTVRTVARYVFYFLKVIFSHAKKTPH